MSKTYISSLLVVLLAGAQTIRAQESLDDVFNQLSVAEETGASVTMADAAAVETSAPAAVQSADLYEQGIAYYKAGKYDEAEAVFSMMLAEDPYNRSAMTYLKRTAQKIAASEAVKLSTSRAQAYADLHSAWNPAPIAYAAAAAGPKIAKAKTADDLAVEEMTSHLKSIVIPSLDFRDANIKDVVLFLTETCRRLDPAGKGVNILHMGTAGSELADQGNISINIVDMNLYEALQFIVEMASMKFEVKANAVVVSPVNYAAEVDMVMKTFDVVPEVGEEMASMAGGDDGGSDDLFGDASASTETGPADVSGFFSIVAFPAGSSAIYQPSFHKLFVKNSPKNIKAIGGILADLEDEAIRKRSQQVEIEAKFVEFSEGAMDELGFDWTMYGSGTVGGFEMKDGTYYQRGNGPANLANWVDQSGTWNDNAGSYPIRNTLPDGSTLYLDDTEGLRAISGNGQNVFGGVQRNNTTAFDSLQSGILASMGGTPASMLFGNGDVDMRLTALEQEGSADVLSAPKVTTKSGNEAIIRVVEMHRYPQDYDVETGQRTAPVVKPQDWEDYGLGVVLKVTPVVDAESNTIDLDLEPQITKFKGYDLYVAGYNTYDSGGDFQVITGNGAALQILMPYFEERTVQTQVTIADGNTVVMGGLVDERTETFRDQVPFLGDIPYLGRFFRTEGSRSEKKNLVIYVKATQVDDRGMTRADRERSQQAAN